MKPAVLFDLDGTLLNTLDDLAAAGNHTLRAMHLPQHPVDAYRQFVGNGIPNLVKRFLPEDNCGEATHQVAMELYKKYYGAHSMDATAPYPGVTGMLASLRANGFFLGVLSNKADENVQQVVAHYFPGCFHAVLGKHPDFPAKPDPASLHAMMEQHGLAPASTLYVGDSDVDVVTAHNGGLFCIGVTWGFRGRDELVSAGADALADDTNELEAIIIKRLENRK